MAKKSYVVPDNQLSLFDLDTPSMPVFDKSRCEARLINYETAARMVETYHYAHRVPQITIAIGLFVDEILSGCITVGQPPGINVQSSICGKEYAEYALELNRLYVHDYCGKNTESWLIGRLFEAIANDYKILVSFADSKQNHLGVIYQATNWLYTGLSDPGGAKEVKINGKLYHSKNIYNTFGTRDLELLENNGNQVEVIGKSLKHRYVYFLGSKSQKRKLRKALKWPVLPYPKAGEND